MKKMKRIIPLVVLALVSVFLLTSCDGMLKSIYKLDANNNQITVTVALDNYYYPISHSVFVELIGPTAVPAAAATYQYTVYGYNYYTITFDGLNDGTYSLTTFYDYYDYGSLGGYGDVYNYYFDGPNGNGVSYIDMPYNDAPGATLNVYFY